MRTRSLLAIATVAVTATMLVGCTAGTAGKDQPTGADSAGESKIEVVASTNVYGQIAEHIGADRVSVTSIISSDTQDPHSFEASARDRLAVNNADLIIENGGGYDAFMLQLRDGLDTPTVVAVELAPGFEGGSAANQKSEASPGTESDAADHEHGDFNEHVWFDPQIMADLAAEVTEQLSALDPAGEATFAAGLASLQAGLDESLIALEKIAAQHAGTGAFLTEPLAGYLIDRAGLVDKAPAGFAVAVEDGRDVAPALLRDALAVVQNGQVSLIIANAQTGGGESLRIEQEARQVQMPVVALSELLAPGQTYLEWLGAAITDLEVGLSGVN